MWNLWSTKHYWTLAFHVWQSYIWRASRPSPAIANKTRWRSRRLFSLTWIYYSTDEFLKFEIKWIDQVRKFLKIWWSHKILLRIFTDASICLRILTFTADAKYLALIDNRKTVTAKIPGLLLCQILTDMSENFRLKVAVYFQSSFDT